MPYFDKVHYLLTIIMIVPQILKLILPRYLGIILFHSVFVFFGDFMSICAISLQMIALTILTNATIIFC